MRNEVDRVSEFRRGVDDVACLGEVVAASVPIAFADLVFAGGSWSNITCAGSCGRVGGYPAAIAPFLLLSLRVPLGGVVRVEWGVVVYLRRSRIYLPIRVGVTVRVGRCRCRVGWGVEIYLRGLGICLPIRLGVGTPSS